MINRDGRFGDLPHGSFRIDTLWAMAGMPQVMTMIVNGSTAGHACVGILEKLNSKAPFDRYYAIAHSQIRYDILYILSVPYPKS